jgi:phospholipid/cholesterol/gamma-HCH transport system substrate-binding protein
VAKAPWARIATFGALGGIAALLAAWLIAGTSSYVIHARFIDAGQLVAGAPVEVGGERVGDVDDLSITPDGQADVRLRLKPNRWLPLHRGTTATIRTPGFSGVANRYVDLVPGPLGSAEIPNGGVLGTDETRPIVDLDEVLDMFDAKTRDDVRRFVSGSAEIYAGNAQDINDTIRYLNPALSQTRALTHELARDKRAFGNLLVDASTVVASLAPRSHDIEQGVGNTGTTLAALASEREAFGDALTRTPALFRRATGSLVDIREAIADVRPAIRDARPLAQPSARIFRSLDPVSRRSVPVVRDARELMGPLKRTLAGIPSLAGVGVDALRSTASAVHDGRPIFEGLRPYAPDLGAALFGGLGASTMAAYDANGHYARAALTEPGNSGVLAPLLQLHLDPVRDSRFGLDARCPGAAAEPAEDLSNPWIPDESICDPEDNHRG